MLTPLVVRKPQEQSSSNSSEFFSARRPVLKPIKKLAEIFKMADLQLSWDGVQFRGGSDCRSAQLDQEFDINLAKQPCLRLPKWSPKPDSIQPVEAILMEYCDGLAKNANKQKLTVQAFEDIFCKFSTPGNQKKNLKPAEKVDKRQQVLTSRPFCLLETVGLQFLQKSHGFSRYKAARTQSLSQNILLRAFDLGVLNIPTLSGDPLEAKLFRIEESGQGVLGIWMESCHSNQIRIELPPHPPASLFVHQLLQDKQSVKQPILPVGWFSCFSELFGDWHHRLAFTVLNSHSRARLPEWKFSMIGMTPQNGAPIFSYISQDDIGKG